MENGQTTENSDKPMHSRKIHESWGNAIAKIKLAAILENGGGKSFWFGYFTNTKESVVSVYSNVIWDTLSTELQWYSSFSLPR